MSEFSLTKRELADIDACTAEMLALPQMVCDKRRCRRYRRCEFRNSESGARWCLGYLTPEQRADWDELREIAVKIADAIRCREPHWDPRIRALEEAAIEIVRNVVLHDPLCYFFRFWLRDYRAAAAGDPEANPEGHPIDGSARQASAPKADAFPPASETGYVDENGIFVPPDDSALDWRSYR